MDPLVDEQWLSFVSRHTQATIYHHPLYLRALAEEYGQPCLHLGCFDEARNLQAVLPLVKVPGLPLKLGDMRGAARLASLPRTPFSGPLAITQAAASALLQDALTRVDSSSGETLEVRTPLPLEHFTPSLQRVSANSTYVLQLPQPGEQLRFGNSRNHRHIKWSMRRAGSAGIVVRPAETESDLRQWHKLYLQTVRWHARRVPTPPRSLRFFKLCWDLLVPSGLAQLTLAERRSGGKAEIVAGDFIFRFRDSVTFAYNGRNREALRVGANDAIEWATLHEFADQGLTSCDFGDTALDAGGLEHFKRKWGAEPKPVYRYRYPGPSHQESGSRQPLSQVLFGKVASQLPLSLLHVLGDYLYSYL